jgi:hypothetical protein
MSAIFSLLSFFAIQGSKPVAVKRHMESGRLKTGTAVGYDSAGASINEAVGNDTNLNAFMILKRSYWLIGESKCFRCQCISLGKSGQYPCTWMVQKP